MVGCQEVGPVVSHDRRSGGDAVKGPLHARPRHPLCGVASAGTHGGGGAVGGLGEQEQVAPFDVVELEGPADCVENTRRYASKGAAFKLGVILDAHPGQRGHLAAAQSGYPTLPSLGHSGLLWTDLGSARGQELADFGSVVHVDHGKAADGDEGCPVGTPIIGDFSRGPGDGLLGA